ncbi:uncharacterized protein LOC134666918 [Cydia fagiglandana]|uniref:uncharacterized protein LOC134666918 n=1 Tax=Cydia fagiglandana TaxID=1458189 RepID=UPI002FEE1798
MTESVSEGATKLDFETVLNNAVGEFGKYQLISILLLAIPAACSGFMAGDYIFTAAMPCGKRPLVKKWNKHKDLRVVTPSRYQQNEASVKVHWMKVIRDLELSYKDDKFWETQRDTVQELVGPAIFGRLAQMFKLPPDDKHYEPPPDTISLPASELMYDMGSYEKLVRSNIHRVYLTYSLTSSLNFVALYIIKKYFTFILDEPTHFKSNILEMRKESRYSVSDYAPSVDEEPVEEEESEWGTSSDALDNQTSRYRSMTKSKSTSSKHFTSRMSITRLSTNKSLIRKSESIRYSKRMSNIPMSIDSPACTDDDLIVQDSKKYGRVGRVLFGTTQKNPHFEMLYCNESETDMIKWNSKYKQKAFEISASDEFSKKAEILAKQISKDFYDWWVGLGNVEFKSEIKRPEDIEDLFQVLFDEHASRALVLDPKILPCVLPSIAKFVGVPKAACSSVLKRQIAYDIHAETSPAHKEAFGTCLPQRMKHIPPNNDTKKMWHSLVIPEDLKTMSAVWDEISHLTSTKSFHSWLQKRPHLPMAKYLKSLETPGEKKQTFVVPSDYVLVKEGSSYQDLALPVSEFTLELKEVLQEIMND